jgi:hypothetical protein
MFEMTTVRHSNVWSVGGQVHLIRGQGNVLFRCDGEVKRILSDVFNVPRSLYSLIWDFFGILRQLQMADTKYPLRTMGGVRSGRRPPPAKFLAPPGIFPNPPENSCPPRPKTKKTLLLHSWRPLDYKPHIECTSPSRSQIQYICALPPSK